MPTRSWNEIKNKKGRISAADAAQIEADAKAEFATFKALREELDLSQNDVARIAGMTQSEVSRFEQRDDHRLSMLRAMVSALGGQLEVTAVLPGGRRVQIRQPETQESANDNKVRERRVR